MRSVTKSMAKGARVPQIKWLELFRGSHQVVDVAFRDALCRAAPLERLCCAEMDLEADAWKARHRMSNCSCTSKKNVAAFLVKCAGI